MLTTPAASVSPSKNRMNMKTSLCLALSEVGWGGEDRNEKKEGRMDRGRGGRDRTEDQPRPTAPAIGPLFWVPSGQAAALSTCTPSAPQPSSPLPRGRSSHWAGVWGRKHTSTLTSLTSDPRSGRDYTPSPGGSGVQASSITPQQVTPNLDVQPQGVISQAESPLGRVEARLQAWAPQTLLMTETLTYF